MKNIIYPILTFLIISCNSTKEIKYNSSIKSDFTRYFTLLENQDFEKSMDYIVDDFFFFFSKEEMIKLLERTYNPKFKIKLKGTKIVNLENAEFIDNKYYSLLSYFSITEFNGQNINDEQMELLINLCEQKYGKKNMKVNKKNSTIEIHSTKNICAISKNNEQWKFLALDNKKPILEKILPKRLLEKVYFGKIRNEINEVDVIRDLSVYENKYPDFNFYQTKLPISEIKTNLEKEAEKTPTNTFTKIIENSDKTCGFIKLVDKGQDTLIRVKYIYLKDKSEKGELAKEIMKEYNNGKLFSDLALKHSKDGNAKKGGDLGWMKTKILASDFVKAVEEHKLNEVFITNTNAFGWYVIKKTHNIDYYKYLEIIKVKSKKNCH